jgi:hypothetical protein
MNQEQDKIVFVYGKRPSFSYVDDFFKDLPKSEKKIILDMIKEELDCLTRIYDELG